MDTRFWGPSGWRFLHLISFRANILPKKDVILFFKNLPYVLPCKFCRASLSEYYRDEPIPTNMNDLPKWLYTIHNKVNDKLRNQKLLETPNPQWEEIQNRYTEWLKTPCSKQRMIGWDFLFSIAYTIPCKAVPSTPMPNAPPISDLTTPELRNQWGVMSREERLPYIQEWWNVLPNVLPFQEWTDAWKQVVPNTPSLEKGRKFFTAWLYKAELAMCRQLKEKAPHNSFYGLCSELQTFSSNCGKKQTPVVKTCRARKPFARKTLKQRRSNLYQATGGYL